MADFACTVRKYLHCMLQNCLMLIFMFVLSFKTATMATKKIPIQRQY